MVFSLATLSLGSRPTPVLEMDDRYYRLDTVAPTLLAKAPHRGLMNLFDDWPSAQRHLQAICGAGGLPAAAEVHPVTE